MGDYALVSPSEKEVKEPHLMRIEKMTKEEEGATLVTGRYGRVTVDGGDAVEGRGTVDGD